MVIDRLQFVLLFIASLFSFSQGHKRKGTHREINDSESKKARTENDLASTLLNLHFGSWHSTLSEITDDKSWDWNACSQGLCNYVSKGIQNHFFKSTDPLSKKDAPYLKVFVHVEPNHVEILGHNINCLKKCTDMDFIVSYLSLLQVFVHSSVKREQRKHFNPSHHKELLNVEGREDFKYFTVPGLKDNEKMLVYVGEENPFSVFPLHQIIPSMFSGNLAFGPYIFANYILPIWRNGQLSLPENVNTLFKRYGGFISPGLSHCYLLVKFAKTIADGTCSVQGSRGIAYNEQKGIWESAVLGLEHDNAYVFTQFLEKIMHLNTYLMGLFYPAYGTYRQMMTHVRFQMALEIGYMWKFDIRSIGGMYGRSSLEGHGIRDFGEAGKKVNVFLQTIRVDLLESDYRKNRFAQTPINQLLGQFKVATEPRPLHIPTNQPTPKVNQDPTFNQPARNASFAPAYQQLFNSDQNQVVSAVVVDETNSLTVSKIPVHVRVAPPTLVQSFIRVATPNHPPVVSHAFDGPMSDTVEESNETSLPTEMKADAAKTGIIIDDPEFDAFLASLL